MITKVIIDSKSSGNIIKMTLLDNAHAIVPRTGEYVMFDGLRKGVKLVSHNMTPYSHEIRIEVD